MADLLEIDGVSLRGQGFGAATRTGRYSMPLKRGENTVIPGASGTVFFKDKPYEEGTGAISLWALGATTDGSGNLVIPATFALQRAAFETNINTIMRLFTRGHKLSVIRAAQPDGSIRRASVEWNEWSEPDVQAGGTRAEWAIAYTIPKVWWEDESATIQAATAGATLPKTLNLTSFTDMTGVIDDAVFTVSGPITNPKITDSETGAWVQYTGAVPNGQSWVVDVAAMTSMVNSATVAVNTTHAGGYKYLMIPNVFGTTNTPQLVLSGSGGGAATNLSVSARRKWVNG